MPTDNSRRTFLKGAIACACCGATMAGCVTQEGENGEAVDADDADDDADVSDDADDDDDDAADDEAPEQDDDYEEFDPLDEDTWYPQLVSTYLDHGFETGSIEELDLFEERDEPHYGAPPMETPDDEDELIDPDIIDFSMVPTEDPAIYEETMEPLIQNMEEETGRDVEYVGLDNYAAQVEAMRSERLHVAGFATGNTPFAVNLAGAVPFSIQVGEGEFGYRLWVITRADNDEINELADLAGRTVYHTEPSSNSGHLAPVAAFSDLGVTPGEDYEIEFSGGHDNSAVGIFQGDMEVGPICSTCYARAQEQENIDSAEIKSVWASAPFPTTAFCYRYNLAPELQEGIMNAFLEYDYQDTDIADEFEDRGTWVEIDYATHWHDILVNHEVNGVEYEDEEIEG